MNHKGMAAFLLAAVLLFGMSLTGTAANHKVPVLDQDGQPVVLTGTDVVNPLYEDLVVLPPNQLKEEETGATSGDTVTAPVYRSTQDVVKLIRESMVNRDTDISFTYESATLITTSEELMDWGNRFLKEAMAVTDTTSSVEGDYLKWHWGSWRIGAKIYVLPSGTYQYDFQMVFTYYTTAEQEKALTQKVNAVLNSLQLTGKSEYEKATAIYDYICSHVTYDYAHVENASYTLQFSAYAAMMEGTAVCQGYANLYYRMCKESGIPARLIAGLGQGGPHAWNIVRIGGLWYNADATWDAGTGRYDWYLQSAVDFPAHVRNEEYDTVEFHEKHPMSPVSYGISTGSMGVGSVNPEYTLDTIDGGKVSTLSGGKVKLLAFVTPGDTTGDAMVRDLLSGAWTAHPDVEVIMAVNAALDKVITYQNNNINTAVTWCYNSNTVYNQYMTQMNVYQGYPFFLLIGQDNQIKWFARSDFSATPSAVIKGEIQKLIGSMVPIPQKLQITGQTVAGVKLQWTAAAGADSYLIYRAAKGGSYELIGSTTGTAYIDTAVSLKDSFSYKIRASKNEIYSAYTAPVTTGIIQYAITDLVLEEDSVSLKEGRTKVMSVTVLPAGANTGAVAFSSSDAKVASVDAAGKITAVSKGKATIYVRATDGSGVVTSCMVTVLRPVEKMVLNQTEVKLAKGRTITLQATVTPRDASNTKVKWTTSNAKIASVSSAGKITAKSYGKAKITATAADGSGVKKSCNVIVGYSLKYKLNGGKNHKNNPEVYYREKVKLQQPTRKGYSFKGWYTDSGYKKKMTSLSASSKKNYTLYAKWEKIKLGQAKLKSVSNIKKNKVKVSYGKVKNAGGYEIVYSTGSKFAKAVTKTVTTKKTSGTLTGLTGKKTYYIKVRAYKKDSADKPVYGKYSKVKKVKIKK